VGRHVTMVGMTRRTEGWIVDRTTIITQSAIHIALGTWMTSMANRYDGKAIVSAIVTAEGSIFGTVIMLIIAITMPKIEIQHEMIEAVLFGKAAWINLAKGLWRTQNLWMGLSMPTKEMMALRRDTGSGLVFPSKTSIGKVTGLFRVCGKMAVELQ